MKETSMSSRPSLAPALLLLALAACQTTGMGRVSPQERIAAEEFAREALAAEQSLDPATLPERTVGVTPLSITTSDSALRSLGYGLADLLMTDLARSAQIQVVDRLRLDALLRELQFVQASRNVDSTTAPRVGGLLGARRLVVGSVTHTPGGELRIDARIANAATSEIRPAVFATATLDDILRAEKELAFQLFDQLGVILTPAERAAVDQRATQNLAALLAYSRGVRYEVEGRFDQAAGEFQSALQLDPGFSMARMRLTAARSLAAPLRAAPIARVAAAAAERVNQALIPTTSTGARPGTPGDPTFAQTYTVTVIVTITTPP